ncbi:short chain dehydrogenase/reductase family [Truncatella angustata]|uniref:Short chain dehydrogenase/reductase family n=1 Tax=Truncatella angustata TaxID=152316 RepID=A0A9P8UMR3_9PEZI|nr:short chain dehydrogenase/reductase family [Truncatella angustata]KAH6655529.1 short chain dehydrogenase/reductase family [Truncatella angustata]
MELNQLFDVKDKVVLVTGGAKGIGLMISQGFVANGAKVYISSRDAKACEAAAEELNSAGPGKAVALPADLLQLSECERLVSELSKRESKLHVLVNNSGIAWGAPLDSFPDEQWSRVLNLNLQRVFTLTQLLLPLLDAAGSPSVESAAKDMPAAVINIGSIDALRVPIMENYSYSAAKAGLHHLSRVLSAKLGPRGITVNTLACGPFETKMTRFAMKTAKAEIEEGNPMGRIGRPGDVAGACIFLASRAGSYVNGATINVDGGVSNLSKM